MSKRGRPSKFDWPVVLADAKTRDLTTSEVAREQGCPYGTVATACERLSIKLRTDGRKRRWDGIRVADRIKAMISNENLSDCSEPTFCEVAQNERLVIPEARTWLNPDVVYVVEEDGGAWCKVGISASNDINRRLRELQSGNARKLSVVFTATPDDPRRIETMVHSLLWTTKSAAKTRGEWFAVSAADAIAAIRSAIETDQ